MRDQGRERERKLPLPHYIPQCKSRSDKHIPLIHLRRSQVVTPCSVKPQCRQAKRLFRQSSSCPSVAALLLLWIVTNSECGKGLATSLAPVIIIVVRLVIRVAKPNFPVLSYLLCGFFRSIVRVELALIPLSGIRLGKLYCVSEVILGWIRRLMLTFDSQATEPVRTLVSVRPLSDIMLEMVVGALRPGRWFPLLSHLLKEIASATFMSLKVVAVDTDSARVPPKYEGSWGVVEDITERARPGPGALNDARFVGKEASEAAEEARCAGRSPSPCTLDAE